MRPQSTSTQPAASLFDGKTCTKCLQWKPFEEFHRDKNGVAGRTWHCKVCACLRVRQYAQENHETVLTKKREAYQANLEAFRLKDRLRYPARKEANYERIKHWRKANPDKAKAISNRQYEKHHISKNEWAVLYRRAHPELGRYHAMNRRIRVKGNGGRHSYEQFCQLCDSYNNICLCCGQAKKLTVDHVIPISKGGSHDISNIQPLCLKCNMKKTNRIIDYRPAYATNNNS